MTNEQAQLIKQYAKILNTNIEEGELLDFVVAETVDRVLIYLNVDILDNKLVRIIARIVNSVYQQSVNNLNSNQPDIAIKSISDNGQSITYADGVRHYLASTNDNELLMGFTQLLAPYRRVNVIS